MEQVSETMALQHYTSWSLPPFRCGLVVNLADMVVVLHSFTKTTNRSDRHAMQVAEDRMKEFKHELRKMGYRV
ncbi:type II toxin-antitoxin system RelE/ParE family toxin [Pseudomonas sp. DCB_CB]|uniref:type II toxin-antitoxin system RelE/ParE family toxin n=1 Tax=Pseudomonas TaxID=286 RepID=UPI000281E808|nr:MULTISPECIES: type II toxin-antitoxin system RelE/ParE family toxin [Pseudomonas]EMR44818.1 hypothetical protein PPUTLS46_024938 [Pseudomonas putida LS46]MCX2693007.1 type II toxin-antitoxin system RelE/ParE family toxin [Pseudomonas sp. DCB_BZ]MCX2856345.1 type II toxin-antitoxin system RelE/ParE family toxin [Pseudomonas sp. DCB_CB]PJX07641.1 hypothetical protein CQW32_24875 [Pseudomonas putida]HEE9760555.1 hypothetical protein [Pseudomonas putida]